VTQVESPYRFEQTDGCSVISLLPELNEAQWADIEKVGNELLARLNSVPSPTFLVDLSALNYMGSAMVALIVRLWKATKERGGDMVVVNRHELVFEVLKLAGLTKLWTVVDSREKGLAELGVSGRVFGSGPQRGPGLIVLGIIGVLGAIAGLWLQLSSSGVGAGSKIAKAVEFGFAALGLVAGTMMLVREGTNFRRNIGIFVLVACVGVVLAGILMAPDGNVPAPAAAPAVDVPAVVPPAAESGSSTPAPAAADAPKTASPRKKNPNRSDDDEPAAAPEAAAAPAAPADPKASEAKPAEKPAEKSLPEVLKEKGGLKIGGDK
jgi:anti-anti-sigma factor